MITFNVKMQSFLRVLGSISTKTVVSATENTNFCKHCNAISTSTEEMLLLCMHIIPVVTCSPAPAGGAVRAICPPEHHDLQSRFSRLFYFVLF